MQQRLQKILASAGIASRRKAEEIITSGRVSLNGQIVTELGTKADPDTDTITVDGKPIKPAQRPIYLMLHKPKGYVTTVSDPEGEIQVREAIAASDSERAHGGSGDDALVFLRELEHSRAQRVPLFDGKHSSAILVRPLGQ